MGIRWKAWSLLLMLTAVPGAAHFTFVVPQPGGEVAELILSETLSREDSVEPSLVAGTQLKLRDEQGKVTALELVRDGHRFVMRLPGRGNRVVYGQANLGVVRRGSGGKPHLLLYYPKTVLGDAFAATGRVGDEQVVEIVPQGSAGAVKLLLVARGKPLAGAEVTVILPDGKQVKALSDSAGVAGPFPGKGRFGAWARYWEDVAGEEGGKRYEQVRHYAMVVFDAYEEAAALAPLAEKTSSFGAVIHEGWLYVYGGHVARTHSYSREAVSGRFFRRRVEGGDWEELKGGEGLQGMNLGVLGEAVCRVGGMQPRNAPGEEADNHSVASVECYSVKRERWERLPDMPAPRSSHDVVSIGGRLMVVGGWNLRGREAAEWAKTMLVLEPGEGGMRWREVAQPFVRRALVAAAVNGKMYVIGGITPPGKVSTEVDIYDPEKDEWRKGAALPGGERNGFAPAAAAIGGKLYVAAGDGGLYVFEEERNEWKEAGRVRARVAHRMVSDGRGLMVLGGARKGENLDIVERVAVD